MKEIIDMRASAAEPVEWPRKQKKGRTGIACQVLRKHPAGKRLTVSDKKLINYLKSHEELQRVPLNETTQDS